MEFFERAHVARDKSSRKTNKSEELLKKQLKQMLYGYEHNDKEIIKNSENIIDVDDSDSISVSGFSDLNITNSTNEGENVHDISICSADNDSNVDEVNLNNSPGYQSDNNVISDDVKSDSDISINTDEHSIENEKSDSVSDHNDDLNSLSEELSLEVDHDSTSTNEHNSSLLESIENTENESEESGSFDADGALASRIYKKLEEKRDIKNSKKRKLEELESKTNNKVHFLGPYKDKLGKVHDVQNEINIEDADIVISENEYSVTESESGESISPADSLNSFPPFVSVTATEMPDQSLSEILAEYKHPTIKNLPSESQNTIYTTNNSDLFSVEDINVSEVQLEEAFDGITKLETNELLDDDTDETMEDQNEKSNECTDESIDQVSESDTAINKTTDQSVSQVIDDHDMDPTQASIQSNENTSIDNTFHSEQIEIDNSDIDVTENIDSPVKIFCKKSSCILVLKHPTEIFIYGKVKVRALSGTIEVFGYTLKDKVYEVFAPYCNYAQYLKTVENPNACYGLFGKLTSAGLSVVEAEEIVTSIGNEDGVVMLKPLNSRHLDFVENNFPASYLFNKPRKDVEKCFQEVSEILNCSLYLSKPSKCLEKNIYWNQALECAYNKSSRGVLCGGKGVGKSTSLRYFVNKLLVDGPVLVVDLDPGQCEFTVAGNLSATVVTEPLLGPNFTHLKRPDMMLNIGMINTMDNPARYVAAVDELITYCSTKERFKNMPWIINTMGMCNTLGLKFISIIIIKLQPTYVLQLDSKTAKKRFEHSLNPSTIKRLYFKYQNDFLFKNITLPNELDYSFYVSDDLKSAIKFNLTITPRDERYLNFLAYFGELINVNTDSLLGITPYEVNMKDLRIGMNVRINEDAITKIINGKIVALCQHSDNDGIGKLFILEDKPLLCHGHGLVRSVDVEKGNLYIITPTPVEKLSLVNTVVYADWVPEIRGQEKYLPVGVKVPYRTSTMYHKRQLMSAPRRRFNPLQLIKMSRKSS